MGEYYLTANDAQYISIAKVSPLRPTIAFADDSTTVTNFITNEAYQFRYRWIFDDGQVGVVGVISEISVPNHLLTKNNRIDVTFNTGHVTVSKIQLLRRIGNGVSLDGEDNTEWYVYQTLDKAEQGYNDDTDYTFPFYGNEGITPVSRVDSDKIFESVPFTADHIEVINNQIVVGGVTEGRDNVDMNVSVEYRYRFAGNYQYGNSGNGVFIFVYNPNGLPMVGDTMFGTFEIPLPEAIFQYTLTSADIVSPLTMANRLSAVLAGLGVPNTVSPIGGGSYEVQPNDPTTELTLYSARQWSQRTFKNVARRDVAIVYYDKEGRCTGAQVVARNIYAKTPYELSVGSFVQQGISTTNIGTMPYLRATITNLPASGTMYYQILLSESDTGDFQQFFSDHQTEFCTMPNPSSWSFEQGDRVRVLYDDGAFVNSVINLDFKIVTFNTSTGVITLEGLASFGGSPYTIFEIYRPNRTTRQLFYEFSGVRNIVGGFHIGNIQNQTLGQPAIVEIYDGDVYQKCTNCDISGAPILDLPFPHQSQHIFTNPLIIGDTQPDIYSPYWNKGRVIVETPTQKRQKYIALRRWSNPLIQDTQVNGLNTWDAGNYNNDLNVRFGAITGMRLIGYVLRTVQEMNISRTMINRNQISNPDGSTQLLVTDRLLGTTNPSEQEYGTKYPGSVCVMGDNLYYIDTIKGKAIRSVSNGEFPISDLFTQKYWRDFSSYMNIEPTAEIVSGVDYKFGDIYFTHRRPTTGSRGSQNTEETIYFNEGQKAWKYIVDMNTAIGDPKVIEGYGWVGQSFFTFMNGKMWKENALIDEDEVAIYLNRFGEQKSFIVETIGMLDADKVKIMLTSQIHSNISPTLVEFFIPESTMYPNGMYSYLKPGNFKYKEGVFYANIKRDWYTKGVPADNPAGNLQIAEGRALRGHVVRVRLTYTTTEYVKLFSTGVGMIASEKS